MICLRMLRDPLKTAGAVRTRGPADCQASAQRMSVRMKGRFPCASAHLFSWQKGLFCPAVLTVVCCMIDGLVEEECMDGMKVWVLRLVVGGAAVGAACLLGGRMVSAAGQAATPQVPNSYLPVNDTETFATIHARMVAAKPAIMQRQMNLLNERYDLSDRPAAGVVMDRTKPVQEGVRVKLPAGITWEQLANLNPDTIKQRDIFPKGFLPLPHANHPEGGMVFPKSELDELLKQESRDLTRFDLDFDIPERFLAEFPPAIYLTTRPDLGDVSQGKLVTIENYYEMFSGILNPKQLEGLRLLLTPFPQQQFNETIDRRSDKPSRGVACFDCHQNGGTNGAFHLVGDIRPQEFRHRIETPALRGVNIQRLFGSQRALKTVEDFTEFEQRAAYFDGDPVIATKKGVNPLERGSQVLSLIHI